MKVTIEIDDDYAGALSITAIKSDMIKTRISATVISLSSCNNLELKKDGTWVKSLEEEEKVVQCVICKWYDPDSEYCQFWHGVRHAAHFCGEGVRKNETDKS